MSQKCCRALPRCADCPVLVAARARAGAHTPIDALFAHVRATAAVRDLPPCVEEALTTFEERRFERVAPPRSVR